MSRIKSSSKSATHWEGGLFTLLGYAVGATGQGSCYRFMGAYFVLFLTDCVLLDPSRASTISSTALYVEAVIGMLVGNLSDHCTSKLGRRRPYILSSGIVIPAVLILITMIPPFEGTARFVYYMVLAILFRAFFSWYEIPFNALGTDIASSYDQRIILRSTTRFFGVIGNVIGYILPLAVLGAFSSNTVTGWRVNGITQAIAVAVSFLLCVFLVRGKDPVYIPDEKKRHNVLSGICRSYLDLLKLKPMKMMVAYKASMAVALAFYEVGMIYYMKYVLLWDTSNSMMAFAFQTGLAIVITPLINKLALLWGKKNQQIYTFTAGGVIGIIFFVFFRTNLVMAFIYIMTMCVVQSCFWQISGSIFYDCVEVDQWVNGKRRQGDIMSLISVLGTVFSAVGIQLFGLMLSASGYVNGVVQQSGRVLTFLALDYVLLPSVMIILCALCLYFMPITKQRFESLRKAISLREKGEDYSAYIEDIKALV